MFINIIKNSNKNYMILSINIQDLLRNLSKNGKILLFEGLVLDFNKF